MDEAIAPHLSPPECSRTHRSSLADALTDNILGALAMTDKTSTTAATDHLLGPFGLINNLEKQVQGLDAEPANVRDHRTQVAFDQQPNRNVPVQRGCWAVFLE